MKRNRLILLGAWILSLVSISYYGGPVSFGLFSLLTLIPVLSLIYILLISFFYRIYQRIDSKEVVANHTVDYFITLQNESFILFPGIKIGFFSSFSEISGLDEKAEYELLPGDGIKVETKLLCKYRGEYGVGVKSVTVTDPLRLFSFTFKNPEPFSTQVKPNPIILTELKMATPIEVMKRESKRNLYENDVILRGYVQGDSMKRINWKASARTGELLVRKEIGEERNGIKILVDSRKYSNDPKIYLPLENRMLELSLALAMFYVNQRIPVVLSYAQGMTMNLRLSSMADFENFYEEFSRMQFLDTHRFENLLEETMAEDDSDIMATIMIFHELSGDIFKHAKLLSDRGQSVDAYIVSEESDYANMSDREKIHLFTIPIDKSLEEIL